MKDSNRPTQHKCYTSFVKKHLLKAACRESDKAVTWKTQELWKGYFKQTDSEYAEFWISIWLSRTCGPFSLFEICCRFLILIFSCYFLSMWGDFLFPFTNKNLKLFQHPFRFTFLKQLYCGEMMIFGVDETRSIMGDNCWNFRNGAWTAINDLKMFILEPF